MGAGPYPQGNPFQKRFDIGFMKTNEIKLPSAATSLFDVRRWTFDVGRSSFKPISVDLIAMRAHVLRMVAGSTVRVTPPALEKTLSETHGLTKKQIKAVIRDLVSDGELVYTYEFGSTFLEPSFNKPVRVSTHVILKPPGHSYQPAPEDIVVQIKPGAAFGDGRHSTSRLAIRGIEYVLEKIKSARSEDHITGRHSLAMEYSIRRLRT